MRRHSKQTWVFGTSLVLVLIGLAVTAHLGRAQNAGVTSLLIPFATNQAGFDTKIEIANTTQDPYGTSAVSGRCAFNFFGVNAPGTKITSVIPSGTVQGFPLSAMAPNFQGYVIATYRHEFGGWKSGSGSTGSQKYPGVAEELTVCAIQTTKRR